MDTEFIGTDARARREKSLAYIPSQGHFLKGIESSLLTLGGIGFARSYSRLHWAWRLSRPWPFPTAEKVGLRPRSSTLTSMDELHRHIERRFVSFSAGCVLTAFLLDPNIRIMNQCSVKAGVNSIMLYRTSSCS